MEIRNTSTYYVYIIANSLRNTFLIDTTADLSERIQHRPVIRHDDKSCRDLLYWETYDDALKAIKREDQLKRFSISKLLRLIQVKNPGMATVENFTETASPDM